MTIVREISSDGRVEEHVEETTHFELNTLQPDEDWPIGGRLEMEVAE